MKITLHLSALDGGPFICRPARTVELKPEEVLCNDIVLPWEDHPHKMRLWVIGNEFGALGAVWADCEQEAFDILVDEALGGSLLCDEPTNEEEAEDISRLGNACEPADLSNAWIQTVRLSEKEDARLLCAFAEARGVGAANLDDINLSLCGLTHA